jgi:hypothetical protein
MLNDTRRTRSRSAGRGRYFQTMYFLTSRAGW